MPPINDNEKENDSKGLIVQDPFGVAEYVVDGESSVNEIMEDVRENYHNFREEMDRLGWSNESIGDPQEQLHIELNKYDQDDYNLERSAVLMMAQNYGLDYREEGDVIIVFARPAQALKTKAGDEDLRRAQEVFGTPKDEITPANDRT